MKKLTKKQNQLLEMLKKHLDAATKKVLLQHKHELGLSRLTDKSFSNSKEVYTYEFVIKKN